MGVKGLILLQNTKGVVFRSGEPVQGILKYSLDKPTKFTSVDICLVGKGKCQWSQGGSNNRSRIHSNKEKYVNKSKQVLAGRVNQKLLAGTYDCPFEFFLPENIPTSFKNKTCTIKYKVIATFVNDNFFRTKNKFEVEVTVNGYVEPLSLEPMIFGLQKDVFSLSSNNKVTVNAEIERTFLTPGENIKLKLKVINDSDVPITIKTELMKYFTYVSDNKLKKIDKKCVKTTTAYLPTLEGKNVTELTCVVPTLTSLYSIQHAKVMSREYKLRLTAKLPFPHTNASVEVPVVIGERRNHLGTTDVGFDGGRPWSSKIPAKDENEQTAEEYFEQYDNNWKALQGKMSQQQC